MAKGNRRTPGSSRSRYQSTGADVVLPKVKAQSVKSQTPTSDNNRGDTISNTLDRYQRQGISTINNRTSVNEIIKILLREEGIFSAAGNAMVAIASNTGYRLAGYDSTGAMSMDVMAMAYSMLDRLDTLHDYSIGFNDKPSVDTLVAQLVLDVVSSGGCGAELVLADDLTPDRLIPLSYGSIDWAADGKGGKYPTQDSGNIELNVATVFVAEHGRQPDEAYAVSLLRPGINNTVYFNEFVEDTRRAINRVGHSRMIAKLITEKLIASAPPEYRADTQKLTAYMKSQYDAVNAALKGLNPEDAIVSYDTVEWDVKDTGGTKSDYTQLMATLANVNGASLKTPASVTGIRASGGQGLSNAETLTYLQVVDALRVPVEEVMSRALTLAVRLLGQDGSVRFEFDPINFRPEEELEAYKNARQQRILKQLSLGLINDARACYELSLRPQEFAAGTLAGTNFESAGANSDGAAEDAERVTSTGRALNPGTPDKAGGEDQ